jgi:hypothetical protein
MQQPSSSSLFVEFATLKAMNDLSLGFSHAASVVAEVANNLSFFNL